MNEDFNTNEWRRKNIHEENIPSNKNLEDEIMNIILRYGGYEVADVHFNDLAEDISEYITNNFTPKQ
jgi:hypothetical protein